MGHRVRDPRPRRWRRADRPDHHDHRPRAAAAQELARLLPALEEETGNDQLKTRLRGPGSVLRSKSPDMVRQEIMATCSPLRHRGTICRAAAEADIDPDRVKFLRTVRIILRAGPLTWPSP